MNCPKCKHAQADGRTECESCQVIFAKLIKPAPAQPPTPQQQPPVPQQFVQAPPAATTAGVVGLLFTIFKYALWTLLTLLVYGFFSYQKWEEEDFHRRRKEKANRGAAQQKALEEEYRYKFR